MKSRLVDLGYGSVAKIDFGVGWVLTNGKVSKFKPFVQKGDSVPPLVTRITQVSILAPADDNVPAASLFISEEGVKELIAALTAELPPPQEDDGVEE